VHEACDVEEDGVAILRTTVSADTHARCAVHTSVTPKSLTVGRPPFSTPSSASICWKTSFCDISLKSAGSGGRRHCWSFSVLFSFSVSMSCVIFSSVCSNWLGAGWLELKEPLAVLTGGPVLPLPLSSFNFFAERGDASTLARLLVASASARFAGVLVTVPGILLEREDKTKGEGFGVKAMIDGWLL
tara:strand:- start:9331 stop:9891 length:561 start_codon:yes stop_codon:yes gene_type:complete